MYMIETLYIISYNGIPIHTQNADLAINASLFAGFITALNILVSELGEVAFKKINMGMSQIFFIKSEEFDVFFIGITRSKVKEKKVLKYLNQIKEKFCTHYENEIRNFRGRMNDFMDVDKIINLTEDPDNFMGKRVAANRIKSFFSSI